MKAKKYVTLSLLYIQLYVIWCDDKIHPSVHRSSQNILFKKFPYHAEVPFLLPNSKLSRICPNVGTLEEELRFPLSQENQLLGSVCEVNEELFKNCQLSTRSTSTDKLQMLNDLQHTPIYHTLNFSMNVKGMRFYFTYSKYQSELGWMGDDRRLAKSSSNSLNCCDGFWLGFICGIFLLFIYSVVVNILLFCEIRNRRKVKPCCSKEAESEHEEKTPNAPVVE